MNPSVANLLFYNVSDLTHLYLGCNQLPRKIELMNKK